MHATRRGAEVASVGHAPAPIVACGRRREEYRKMDASIALLEATGFELRFVSLFNAGRALAFPCDGAGHVDLDALSPRAIGNYLYARAMVGREFRPPAVVPPETGAH
jgi:hypothetical protein